LVLCQGLGKNGDELNNNAHDNMLANATKAGINFSNNNPPKDGWFESDGLKLHFLDWGNENDPVCILLHGFAQTAHSWDFISLSLSQKYRVIVLDQRGHGDSDWDKDKRYSTEYFVKDINNLVKNNNLNNFNLIGLSMGGRNSYYYASENQNMINKLVIVDTGPETIKKGSSNIKNFVQMNDELDSIEEFVERIKKYNPHRTEGHIRGNILNNIKQLENGKWTWKYDSFLRSGFSNRNTHQKNEDQWKILEKIETPTLIVKGGKSDILAESTLEKMSDVMANAQSVTVEEAGHLVPGDNPIEFTKILLKFLEV